MREHARGSWILYQRGRLCDSQGALLHVAVAGLAALLPGCYINSPANHHHHVLCRFNDHKNRDEIIVLDLSNFFYPWLCRTRDRRGEGDFPFDQFFAEAIESW